MDFVEILVLSFMVMTNIYYIYIMMFNQRRIAEDMIHRVNRLYSAIHSLREDIKDSHRPEAKDKK